jgi:hypothetical protein
MVSRTPLTLLRADAEMLLRSRDRFSPDDAELLEDIAAEASHMGPPRRQPADVGAAGRVA